MNATAECSIAIAVPATLVTPHDVHSSLLGNNLILLDDERSSNGVSPLIMVQTSKTLFSIQSDIAELSLMVIKAAGIAALYASDEESRIATATSFATVKLADKGFGMAGRLLIPDRGGAHDKAEVVSVNLSPLYELLDQYDTTNFDVDSIVSGTSLGRLVSAAKEAARAAIEAAKAANACSVNPTAHSAMVLAQAAANTSAKAARLNTAALEVSSSFL
mmetsp:Transcript_19527/g.27811  ORF Transcript_19527/g.27811 Transcript_19527/m.27811 type:complete len:218 (+) Transcript_19527:95-748(+)|eukprot:CAMPEP_0201697604 /NCGR_PEP_ID=MMETSP0578-20130828/11413_1 /ASSEMBLY_ACC=CAM_ASM_000663 /TAXON_ID=267565 /ORGANISM="Skeletonema grethea, Strain CCMP 1804" /LENGTH=217 /DNA_ID=CAMNT_0048183809 /DNA_START=84 /DNA_END=737 /DNA_ORIENTATION=-